MIVAAFDFDGTLTQRDTLLGYLRLVVGRRRVATVVARNAVGILRASRDRNARDLVKEEVLAGCLAGVEVARATALAAAYVARIPMRADVVARLLEHHALGHTVVVVSASPAIYVAPAVASWGVDDVLATELEVVDGVFTGRYAGRNCRAEEKVVRLESWLAGREVELHAYGNSPDDAAMLARADHPVWV
jgi:phosphatidylglycerophosphatase C